MSFLLLKSRMLVGSVAVEFSRGLSVGMRYGSRGGGGVL